MRPLGNPHPSGDQLHTDFAVVSAAQLGPARAEAAQALLRRTGCLGDALTYYQGADPAHEVDNAHFDRLTFKEQYDEMLGRSVIGLHAAELLLASVVHPGYYERRDSRRVRILGKDATWYSQPIVKGRVKTTPYDTIGEALDHISEDTLATADATTLSMGTEMLSSALTWWQIAQIKLYRADPDAFVSDHKLRAVLSDSERAMLVSTIATQDMLKRKMIDEPLPDVAPQEQLQRAALGLKAQWRSGAILTHPIFRHASPEKVHEVLGGMVESVYKEFVEGDLLETKTYPRKDVKGLLHELMWLVDAQMVMLANPSDYPTIHVGPSSGRLDRPVIGRPALLRGIDYAIADVDIANSQTHLINLKSGNGDDREYHPRIKPVKERNFQDINRGRLTNKLRHYRGIIDSGFSLPDTREIVEKYALESVREELAAHKNPSPSEAWPYLLSPLT